MQLPCRGCPAERAFSVAELHGFKQRASHVMESSTADSESLADFASRANDDLDALMEVMSYVASRGLAARQSTRSRVADLGAEARLPSCQAKR